MAEALQGRGIPFLFLTGYGSDRILAPYKGVPALTKPVDFDKMCEAVASLVDSKM